MQAYNAMIPMIMSSMAHTLIAFHSKVISCSWDIANIPHNPHRIAINPTNTSNILVKRLSRLFMKPIPNSMTAMNNSMPANTQSAPSTVPGLFFTCGITKIINIATATKESPATTYSRRFQPLSLILIII